MWMNRSRLLSPTVFVLLFAGVARAQDTMLAGEALTLELCEKMRDEVLGRIENYTRLKFRRHVPMRVEPRGVWENKIKRDGYGGTAAKHALAYYSPGRNVVTVVPWVIGGYAGGSPSRRSMEGWIADLQPTMIHELTHAIHHQNFFSEGRFFAASLRNTLSEEDLDRSTVDFLMGEGVPELVALRTTDYVERMHRRPDPEMTEALRYMNTYRADGKQAYRIKLLAKGYVDGLNLMHHLAIRAGERGIRAVLYRPPPRQLLFHPEILAAVDLDDPPEPDSMFQFLWPAKLGSREIFRATFPGAGRYFKTASVRRRAKGCLIGYATEVSSDRDGEGRYSFFVADPDKASPWVEAQANALKELHAAGTVDKQVPLPLSKIKARLITVTLDGSQYVYAATSGLVVIAHETRPTKNLKERVLRALRYLYIRRPKKDIYKAATQRAIAKLAG